MSNALVAAATIWLTTCAIWATLTLATIIREHIDQAAP